MENLTDFFGPVIHSYTRAQAIEDGYLVELPTKEIREAGLGCPVAMTRAAWSQAVEMTPMAEQMGCDITGRIWDVAWMLSMAIRSGRMSGVTGTFKVGVVQDKRRPKEITLKCVAGPGDSGEMVMTIMLPHED